MNSLSLPGAPGPGPRVETAEVHRGLLLTPEKGRVIDPPPRGYGLPEAPPLSPCPASWPLFGLPLAALLHGRPPAPRNFFERRRRRFRASFFFLLGVAA